MLGLLSSAASTPMSPEPDSSRGTWRWKCESQVVSSEGSRLDLCGLIAAAAALASAASLRFLSSTGAQP